MLAVFIARSDPGETARTLRHIEPLWVMSAVAAMLATTLLGALRWKLLLRGMGHEVRVARLFRLWLMGYFFDAFLPSTVGGDVARGWGLRKARVPLAPVATTLVVGRVLGFTALGMWGAIILLASPAIRGAPTLAAPNVVGAMAGLGGLVFLLAAMLTGSVAHRLEARAQGPGRTRKVMRGVGKLWGTVATYRASPSVLPVCLLLSMGVWAVDVFILLSCLESVGASLGYLSVMGLNTTFNWAGALPVSVGGTGVQEGTLSVLVGGFGLSATVGLAAGLAYRGVRWLMGLVGGLIAWVEGGRF